jgi:serine/threonine protein kinase/tetratricopeptide (TPR) repeat protein
MAEDTAEDTGKKKKVGDSTASVQAFEAWSESETGTDCRGKALRAQVGKMINPKDPEDPRDNDRVGDIVAVSLTRRAQFIAKELGLAFDMKSAEKKLGKGGFGFVYRADDPMWKDRAGNARRVALKLLNPLLVEDDPPGDRPADPKHPTHYDRFRNEYDILDRLAHPGLPKVYRGGEVKGQPFYVMEYGGVDLERYATLLVGRGGGLPAVVRFAADLLDVLAYVHSHGITHRDLKPANILVHPESSPGGTYFVPMLIDFGIAQYRNPDAPQDTKTGREPGGTEGYSDPNLASYGDKAQPADIYSFGKVLDFLRDKYDRHGTEPTAETPAAQPDATPPTPVPPGDRAAPAAPVDRPAPTPGPADGSVLSRLKEIAARCTRPAHDGRYETIEKVRDEVRALLEPAPELAPYWPPEPSTGPDSEDTELPFSRNLKPFWPPGPSAGPRPAASGLWTWTRLRWLVAGVMLLLLLIGGFAGYALAPDRRAELAVLEARAKVEEAKLAIEGDSPDEAIDRYREAIAILKAARAKWPRNEPVAVLLAKTYQQLGKEYERAGRAESAKAAYTDAIHVWKELRGRDETNDEYLRELALAHGCHGDVNIKTNDEGYTNEIGAMSDYKESMRIRKELADKCPENHDYQIQYAVAETNFARLEFYKSKSGAMKHWGTVKDLLGQVRGNPTATEKIRREATKELAYSLLDHLNGYFAVVAAEKPKTAPLSAEAGKLLNLASALCADMRSAHDPDAVVREIALAYFKTRLGVGSPDDQYATQLERLQTHIASLPRGKRDWAKSLFVEIVLEMKREDTGTWKNEAAAYASLCGGFAGHLYQQLQWKKEAREYARELPTNNYFYSEQFRRWNRVYPTDR